MPVNTSLLAVPARRWCRLWALWLTLGLLLAGGGWMAFYWPLLWQYSSAWQRDVHQHLVELLQHVQEAPQQTGLILLVTSFIYGVLHAAGPGHGKVIISTYLATHSVHRRSSLILSLCSSLLQGGVAIVLVSLFLVVLRLSSRSLHQSSFWLEKGSYLLVIVLGAALCYRAIRRLWHVLPDVLRQPEIARGRVESLQDKQSELCGCGHRLLPTEQQLTLHEGWRARLMLMVTIGLRPCSGALLVLIFAKVIGVFSWGIAAVMAMSLGTALTLSLLVLLVHVTRRMAQDIYQDHPLSSSGKQVMLFSLSFLGGILLMLAGTLLNAGMAPAEMPGTGRIFVQ